MKNPYDFKPLDFIPYLGIPLRLKREVNEIPPSIANEESKKRQLFS
jgi:hypothetical protein